MLVVQASTDPEYQALLAKQAGLDAPTATQIAAGLLSQQQKEAGLASVFKRDDENLARRYGAVSDHLPSSLNLCRTLQRICTRRLSSQGCWQLTQLPCDLLTHCMQEGG